MVKIRRGGQWVSAELLMVMTVQLRKSWRCCERLAAFSLIDLIGGTRKDSN